MDCAAVRRVPMRAVAVPPGSDPFPCPPALSSSLAGTPGTPHPGILRGHQSPQLGTKDHTDGQSLVKTTTGRS